MFLDKNGPSRSPNDTPKSPKWIPRLAQGPQMSPEGCKKNPGAQKVEPRADFMPKAGLRSAPEGLPEPILDDFRMSWRMFDML